MFTRSWGRVLNQPRVNVFPHSVDCGLVGRGDLLFACMQVLWPVHGVGWGQGVCGWSILRCKGCLGLAAVQTRQEGKYTYGIVVLL